MTLLESDGSSDSFGRALSLSDLVLWPVGCAGAPGMLPAATGESPVPPGGGFWWGRSNGQIARDPI